MKGSFIVNLTQEVGASEFFSHADGERLHTDAFRYTLDQVGMKLGDRGLRFGAVATVYGVSASLTNRATKPVRWNRQGLPQGGLPLRVPEPQTVHQTRGKAGILGLGI